MVDSIGPPEEQAAMPDRHILEQFDHAVASLAGGGLTFPTPFDLSTSRALLHNQPGGDYLAAFLRHWTGVPIRFLIQAEVDGLAPREVVNTVIEGEGALAALLVGLAQELLGGNAPD